MDEAGGSLVPLSPATVPLKRKRGRPPKNPDSDSKRHQSGSRRRRPLRSKNPNSISTSRKHNALIRQSSVSDRTSPVSNSGEAVVGLPVHGVIEATFDAGYLLAVRVGNSDDVLRGVVFRPGSYTPVLAGNDVAKGLEMIKRRHVPFLNEFSKSPVLNGGGGGRRSVSRTSSPVASAYKSGHSSPLPPPPPPGLCRGNFVPVVLQPVDLSNGSPSTGGHGVSSPLQHRRKENVPLDQVHEKKRIDQKQPPSQNNQPSHDCCEEDEEKPLVQHKETHFSNGTSVDHIISYQIKDDEKPLQLQHEAYSCDFVEESGPHNTAEMLKEAGKEANLNFDHDREGEGVNGTSTSLVTPGCEHDLQHNINHRTVDPICLDIFGSDKEDDLP